MENLDEIKNAFIVDQDVYSKEKLPGLVKRTLVFCKVDKTGRVLFESIANKLTNADKMRLVLLCRFLANKLNKNINASVAAKEISDFSGISKDVVFARAKELIDQNDAKSEGSGKYVLLSHRVDQILDGLEKKMSKK